SRRRHTRFSRDWSSDVCSSDLGQFIKETQVDIDFAVTRTIKWSRRGRCKPTSGTNRVRKKHHCRRCVSLTPRLENPAPDIFSFSKNRARELGNFIIRDTTALGDCASATLLCLDARPHSAISEKNG